MNIGEHFAALSWKETTVQVAVEHDGRIESVQWPRSIGQSADGKTALELIGHPNNIRVVSLLGEMSASDLEATKRNGAYAAVCLAIVAPQWKGRDQWLSKSMKRLRITRVASIIQNGWQIRMTFDPRTSMFNFKASR